MTLSKKQITNVFIAFSVLVLIYANRGSLHLNKEPLNANEDSDDAIDRAINKLKSGGVAVKSTPEEATQSV